MKTLMIILATLPFLSFTLNDDNTLNNAVVLEKFVFGAPKSSFKDLALELESRSSHLYNVNPADVNIPGVEFEYVRAAFTKNKLSAISMSTKNSTRGYFLKYLKDNYGTPAKTSTTYEWEVKNVKIVYEPYKTGHDAAVSFVPLKKVNA
jgi:hypothetical protein